MSFRQNIHGDKTSGEKTSGDKMSGGTSYRGTKCPLVNFRYFYLNSNEKISRTWLENAQN
jgi:hypothetical protein